MQKFYNLTKTCNQLHKILCKNRNLKISINRNFCMKDRPAIILGIETSCDDTGFAIVDTTGKIISEALHSQLTHHLPLGGINPPVARDLHQEYIQNVYEECFRSANMTLDDIDAIAVTVEPGLPLSLIVGRDFALNLSRSTNYKPLIPIHHMQAHALTVRMTEKVDFPFLVLLISGGHCLLVLAEAVDKYKLLGYTQDDAPGEAFDKMARRLRLINISEYSKISGGQAIELAARKANNPDQFPFPVPLCTYRNCNFSFSGLKNVCTRHIIAQEHKYNIKEPDVIPDFHNLCAAFLLVVTKHLCMRTQRAMEFIIKNELIPEDKRTLVISGGVGSNNFIAGALNKVCLETGFRLARPPPKLCTDNGIMVAWNGVERYLTDKGILRSQDEIEKVDIAHRSPIGESWCDIVTNEGIKRKWVKIKFNEIINS